MMSDDGLGADVLRATNGVSLKANDEVRPQTAYNERLFIISNIYQLSAKPVSFLS